MVIFQRGSNLGSASPVFGGHAPRQSPPRRPLMLVPCPTPNETGLGKRTEILVSTTPSDRQSELQPCHVPQKPGCYRSRSWPQFRPLRGWLVCRLNFVGREICFDIR